MTRMFSRLLRGIRRRRTPPTIAVDERGFVLSEGAGVPEPELVAWPDVRRVVAFKRDCWGYDSVRLLFELFSGDACEVYEELEGWKVLVDSLPDHLPGCEPWADWFYPVARVPLATSARVIFERT